MSVALVLLKKTFHSVFCTIYNKKLASSYSQKQFFCGFLHHTNIRPRLG